MRDFSLLLHAWAVGTTANTWGGNDHLRRISLHPPGSSTWRKANTNRDGKDLVIAGGGVGPVINADIDCHTRARTQGIFPFFVRSIA